MKNKKMIIIITAVLIIIICIFAILVINNDKNKRLEQEYKDLIISTSSDLYQSEKLAKFHSAYISSIWYNSIFKKRDSYTDKYAFPEDKYGYGINMWADFSDAINNYISDNCTQLELLSQKDLEFRENLNKLQSKNNKNYQNHIIILNEMYSNFSSLISLVNSPTGTYKEYVEKTHKYEENFDSEYKKILILLLEIESK